VFTFHDALAFFVGELVELAGIGGQTGRRELARRGELDEPVKGRIVDLLVGGKRRRDDRHDTGKPCGLLFGG
jgi:hypothetical protein